MRSNEKVDNFMTIYFFLTEEIQTGIGDVRGVACSWTNRGEKRAIELFKQANKKVHDFKLVRKEKMPENTANVREMKAFAKHICRKIDADYFG